MGYVVKRIVSGTGATAFLALNEEHYQSLLNARAGLREGLYLEQKFDYVLENYLCWEATLLQAGAQDMIFRGQGFGWYQNHVGKLDRQIMNFLTTSKNYIDCAPQHANRIIQNGNLIATEFLRESYDNKLGYRAMNELRNFVQHQGLPVHSARFDTTMVGDDSARKFVYVVNAYLLLDDVKESKFKKRVIDELRMLGEKIDLKFLIRDFVEGLGEAHDKIRTACRSQLNLWESEFSAVTEKIQVDVLDSNPIIGLSLLVTDSGSRVVSEIPFFTEALAYRGYLERKNSMLTNLARRYVSNE